MKPTAVHILTKEKFVSADKTYDVECKSSGSRPAPAMVTWWRGNKQIKRLVKNVSLCVFMFFFYLLSLEWIYSWIRGGYVVNVYIKRCFIFVYFPGWQLWNCSIRIIYHSQCWCLYRNTIEIMVLWLFGSLFEGQTFFFIRYISETSDY